MILSSSIWRLDVSSEKNMGNVDTRVDRGYNETGNMGNGTYIPRCHSFCPSQQGSPTNRPCYSELGHNQA